MRGSGDLAAPGLVMPGSAARIPDWSSPSSARSKANPPGTWNNEFPRCAHDQVQRKTINRSQIVIVILLLILICPNEG